MSILCNFDDVLPDNWNFYPTGYGREVAKTWGAFGNGMRMPYNTWVYSSVTETIVPRGQKATLSALFLLPALGQTNFSIGGVGFRSVDRNSSAINGMTVIDGRNTPTGGSTGAHQRAYGQASSEVVFAYQIPGLKAGVWYRVEYEYNHVNDTTYTMTGRWYIHETNSLIVENTVSLNYPLTGSTDMWPTIITYGPVQVDCVQLQVGGEPYLPNAPVKTWNGTSWAKTTMKKWSGSDWLPVYTKVFKAGQWIW